MENRDTPRGIKSVRTCFDIVEAVMASKGVTLSEIAEELDMAPSSVHEHITTLKERGLLVEDSNGYNVGLKFLEYGAYAKRTRLISELATPVLEELAQETQETATLLVEEQGYGVILSRATGERAVDPIGHVGGRYHLHYLASGKALLAHLPDQRIEEIVEIHGLPEKTSHTITEKEDLWEEIETIRDRRIAFEEEEATEGLWAVGAPIISGDTYAGIEVAGPANRIRREELKQDMPESLLGAANEIKLRLTHNI